MHYNVEKFDKIIFFLLVTGSLYRLQCSSTGSGVANMYSFSNQNSITTPMDTTVLVDLESVNTAETRERLGMSYSHTFSRPVLSPKTIKQTNKSKY